MRKVSLVLVISASFIAGTLVTGNYVFADDTDGQNSLLDQILEVLQVQVSFRFVEASLVPQTVTCPDLSEPSENYEAIFFGFYKGQSNGLLGGIELKTVGNQFRLRVTANNGEVTESDYILKGSVIGQESLCSGITIHSVATFSGECGIGKTATLETEEGLVIVFDANVVCG